MRRLYPGVVFVAILSTVNSATLERIPSSPDSTDGNLRECIVDTPLRRNQGLVIRDRMPDGFDGSKPCRTTLKSPEGKPLKMKLDLAILNGKRDFLQITVHQNMWYIDKTCAPCHEEIFEGYEFTIEFLLTNSSKFQLRYSIHESDCPFLKIVPPLVIRSPSTMTRKVGASFQLECLTSKDYKLIGESRIHCQALPNGSANWSAPLPTCEKISNCPGIEKVSERSGHLYLRPQRNENYHCSWEVDAPDFEANFIEFVPRFEWHKLGHWEAVGRNRGLAFYDGEGRLKVDSGVGLRYRTRDSTLKIYFNLPVKEHATLPNASFTVDYEIWKKTCPTIDEEAFPFGNITLTDSFFVGSSAKFECATGYKMFGKSEALCLKSGDWNFQAMPECALFSSEIDNDDFSLNSVISEATSVASISEAPVHRAGVLTTEKDVLSYTDWSIPRGVTVASIKAEDKSDSTTVDTNSAFAVQRQRQQHLVHRPQQSTSPPTNEYYTTSEIAEPHLVPTSIPAQDGGNDSGDRNSKVPFLGSLDGVFHRLQTIDLGNKQDISFILILLAVISSAVLIVIMVGFSLQRRCKEKIPLRENPMYMGAPARRIQNVSFRPNGKHKRAAQQRNYS